MLAGKGRGGEGRGRGEEEEEGGGEGKEEGRDKRGVVGDEDVEVVALSR